MTLYTLTVWLVITLPDGDKVLEKEYAPKRLLNHAECEYQRKKEYEFYTILRNQDVGVFCEEKK